MPDAAPAPFAGKIAVVTGGAQGLGEATARLLAARGAAGIVITDRQADKGEAVAKSLNAAGTKTVFVAADLANPGDVARVIPAADKAFGRVDVLANIAGLTDRGTILDTDQALFDKMFAINVRAPFFLMQDAIAVMQRERIEGTIVNILSVNAYIGSPNLAAYSASKGALMTLTKNTANAVNMLRIRVNGINLGWADTPGEHVTLKRFHDAADDWLEKAEPTRPFGRLIKPDDVARLVAFLAGPESAPMTGSCVDFEQTVIGASGGGAIGYPVKQ
ncbi:MAG: SDR family oxidoreductase [Devosia sp.]|uniref:SDR family oxidoreductase n=1 Tax=Devosia sp. TaxID=1871048 RepID=UPI001AD2AB49|nr:SDR family oxidoreductase [Devosia sp.]MBN9311063.1 SDR family oxidoreductase [Devosia sp.]MBN9316991.1 SDR family oxidoreductase [Devosia sp.]